MNTVMTPDLGYFNSMKKESYSNLSITIPNFEIYASRKHLEYVNEFAKNLKLTTQIVDRHIQDVIEEEKRYFSNIIQKSFPKKKPSTQTIHIYLDHLNVFAFYDQAYEDSYQNFIKEKKLKLSIPTMFNSSIKLDESYTLDKSLTQSVMASNEVTLTIKMLYLQKEFLKSARGFLSVYFSQLESIIFTNPKLETQTIHFEVYDFSILDRLQTRVTFGNYSRTMDKEEADEILDKRGESFYAICYKQSRHNWAERSLS
jgi:hypothetical protein